VFLCGVFAPKDAQKTPLTGQTNDFYSPASRTRDDYFQIVFQEREKDVFMWSFCAKRCAKNSTDRANQRFLFACVADTR